MGIANGNRCLPWLLTSIVWTGMASALSPDPAILALIPPSAQIVDGTGAPPLKAERKRLLIFTPENRVDLQDFRALVGVDDSKSIRQIFLVRGTQSPGLRYEHSVLAVGHFNQSHIYRAAIQNRAQARDYRGLKILEMLTFSRDPGGSRDSRWLAVIGPELALFGTVSNVREELDRYLDHLPAAPALQQRLARLDPDDEMWCLLPNLSQYQEIRKLLGDLDPRFLEVAADESPFEFGIHYGGRIRLDYEFTPSSPVDATIADPHSGSALGREPGVESFLSHPGHPGDAGSVHGVISVPRARYEKWLAELSAPK